MSVQEAVCTPNAGGARARARGSLTASLAARCTHVVQTQSSQAAQTLSWQRTPAAEEDMVSTLEVKIRITREGEIRYQLGAPVQFCSDDGMGGKELMMGHSECQAVLPQPDRVAAKTRNTL